MRKHVQESSGLAWHLGRIHPKTIVVGDGLGEHTVDMAQEQAFGERQGTVTETGALDNGEQVSPSFVKLMLEQVKTTLRELQGQPLSARTRLDKVELDLGTLPGMQIELREVVEQLRCKLNKLSANVYSDTQVA